MTVLSRILVGEKVFWCVQVQWYSGTVVQLYVYTELLTIPSS